MADETTIPPHAYEVLISALWFALLFVLGVIFAYTKSAISKLEKARENHELRLQSVEQMQGAKLEELGKKVETMQNTLQELVFNVHREKNQESALNATMTAILKFLEKSS